MPDQLDTVSPDEFDALFDRCSNWGRWGDADERGTLNTITHAHLARAATLVQDGVTVSCAREVSTEPAIDVPRPAVHFMSRLPTERIDGLMGASCDYIGVECHGEVQSHIDALCHISYKQQIYNGRFISSISSAGAQFGDLLALSGGIATRGVLLDLAAVHGQRWLPPGFLASVDDLEAAAGDLEVGPGDAVLIRTGHATRRRVEGPFNATEEKAGLHPRVMSWFKDRDVAVLGFDGDGDAAPHVTPHLVCPIHVLGIVAIGLPFLDALDLDRLAEQCAASGRSEFMFVTMPLPLRGATGCLVNPVALF